jgi:hypothetical protein
MARTCWIASALVWALVWTGPSAVLAKGGGACFCIGGHPAAETRELLERARALAARGDEAGLLDIRASGKVLVPQGKKAENVQCGPDGLCQVTVFGKRLWMARDGLQCP